VGSLTADSFLTMEFGSEPSPGQRRQERSLCIEGFDLMVMLEGNVKSPVLPHGGSSKKKPFGVGAYLLKP
jgi:hypothetical protein